MFFQQERWLGTWLRRHRSCRLQTIEACQQIIEACQHSIISHNYLSSGLQFGRYTLKLYLQGDHQYRIADAEHSDISPSEGCTKIVIV